MYGQRAHIRKIPWFAAEVRVTKVDEFVLLRLYITEDHEELWLRRSRTNFLSLIEYLSTEAQWIKGH